MATIEFLQGQVARLSVAVTNISGVATDADGLTLRIKYPNGEILVFPSTSITKDSTGNYHYDLTLVDDGSYYIRWESIGQTQGATEAGLFVFASAF